MVFNFGVVLKRVHIKRIETFQNKVLRNKVNAWFSCKNSDIHRDLGIDHGTEEIQNYAQKHETRLHHHVNVEAI